ncbi:hypothetical protein MJK72_27265 [Klebsiella pneumoniae]|nr:hypothetical protein MJK72_27265 [Klebsiella pneumoniae]
MGHLPWFERIWFALSNHPILLAIFAAISDIAAGMGAVAHAAHHQPAAVVALDDG